MDTASGRCLRTTFSERVANDHPSTVTSCVQITMAPANVSVGLKETPYTKKGFPTTKLATKAKPSHSKGKLSEKKKFARDIIREVRVYALYHTCSGVCYM